MRQLERLLDDGSWHCELAGGTLRTARFAWVGRSRATRAELIEGLAGRKVPETEWEAVLVEALLGLRASGTLVSLELHLSFGDASLARCLAALVSRVRPDLASLVVTVQPYDPLSAGTAKARISADAAASFARSLPALETLQLRGHGLLPGLAHPKIRHLTVEGYRAVAGIGRGEVRVEHPLPALNTLSVVLDRRAVPRGQGVELALGVVAVPLRRLDLRGARGWFDSRAPDGQSVAGFLERLADRGFADDLEWLGLPVLRDVDAMHVARWRSRLPRLRTLAVDVLDDAARTELTDRVRELRVRERAAIWVDTIEAGTARRRLEGRPDREAQFVESLVTELAQDLPALRELHDTLPASAREPVELAIRAIEDRGRIPDLPPGVRTRLGRPVGTANPLDVTWPRVTQRGSRLTVASETGTEWVSVETVSDARFALDHIASQLAVELANGAVGVVKFDHPHVVRPVLEGRGVSVRGLAFARDGALLACVTTDRRATLVDLRSANAPSTIDLDSPAGPVALSGNDWLVAGHDDGTVSVWDVASTRRVATFRGHEGPVAAVAASGSGRFAASVGRPTRGTGRTLILDLQTLAAPVTLEGDHAPSPRGEIRFRHGRLEARLGTARRAFDPATGSRLAARDRLRQPYRIAISADGTRLGTAPDVTLWDLETATRLRRLGSSRDPGGIAFAPSGRWIAAIVGREATLFDESGALVGVVEEPDCLDLALSSDQLVVATPSAISAWSLPGLAQVWRTQIETRPTRIVTTGRWVVGGSFADQLVRLDAATGTPSPIASAGSASATLHDLAVTSDGVVVASSTHPHHRTWRVGTDGSLLSPLEDLEGNPIGGQAMAWSPDGTRAAFAGPHEIHVYEPGEPTCRRTATLVPPAQHQPVALAFTPDNELLSAGRDETILVWSGA